MYRENDKKAEAVSLFQLAKRLVLILVVSIAIPISVDAAWYEASTENFLIYSKQSEKTVRKFAERLELYHSAMSWFYQVEEKETSPSNRVVIYVVGSQIRVRQLHGGNNKNVVGFYIPRAGGSVAYVPKISNNSKSTSGPAFILYHEYAHHFQYQISGFPLPRWLSEGFAEFFASIKFEKEGGVGLGIPAYHRGHEMLGSKNVPIRRLLSTSAYFEGKTKGYDNFYGKSWALFHMLQFSPERKGQFRQFMRALSSGKSEIEASEQAFGDLDKLEQDLNNYIAKRSLAYLPVSAEKLHAGEITIRKLGKGAAKVMQSRAEIRSGITRERAKELYEEIAQIAEKFPEDRLVLDTMIEISIDALRNEEAIAWADRLLARDENNVAASYYKGLAMEQIKRSDPDSEISWRDIRMQYVRANRLEPDNPKPLIRFYLGYTFAEQEPTKNSVNGLIRALNLAPHDDSLRLIVVGQLTKEQRYDEAIAVLQPLAKHPHAVEKSEKARELIRQIEKARKENIAD